MYLPPIDDLIQREEASGLVIRMRDDGGEVRVQMSSKPKFRSKMMEEVVKRLRAKSVGVDFSAEEGLDSL